MFKLKTLVLDIANFANNLITPIKINTTGASSGDVISFDGTNAVWDAPAGGGGSLISLTTTFADCENTTDEIDIVTVTIPADTLAVGDIIVLEMAYLRHQNSGGTINLTAKTILGGTTDVNANSNVTTDSAINNIKAKLQYYAISESGSNINLNTNKSTAIISNAPIQNILSIGATTQANGSIQTSGSPLSNVVIDKTVSNTYKISAKWASANANTYIRVQEAQAYIIKKAV